MQHLSNSKRPNLYYCTKFARRLAEAADAEIGLIGIFDCANCFFLKHWASPRSGLEGTSVPDAVHSVTEAIRDHLKKHDIFDQTSGESPNMLETDDALICFGGWTGTLVAVAAIYKHAKPAGTAKPDQNLMELGTTFANQQLSEMHTRRGAAATQSAEHLLSRLSVNFALVDATGKVLYMSPQSRSALRDFAGLHSTNGRLTADCREHQKDASGVIASVASGQTGTTLIPLSDRTGGLHNAVVMSASTTHASGLAMVVFGAPRYNRSLQDQFLEGLGLTPSERRVALHLINGLTIAELAQQLNLKLSTARGYLKRIFTKTGATRQSELILLCYRLLPPIDPDQPELKERSMSVLNRRVDAVTPASSARFY